MSKIRINDLARELEVKSREILDVLTTVGVTEKKTHSSSLEDFEADLVRKHLRGRSEASSSSAKTSRPARDEEGIKTKIDLSNISRPGDVLRAITQQKGAVEQPVPPRAVVKPPVAPSAVEAKVEAPDAPAVAKAVPPPKPAVETPAPAPRMVTPASVAAQYRPPAVVVIPPKVPPTSAVVTPPAAASTTPAAVAIPPRGTTPAAPGVGAPPVALTSTNVAQMQSISPARQAAPVAPPPRMIMPQTGPRPVYKAPLPPSVASSSGPSAQGISGPNAASRPAPGRPVPGQPIFQRTSRPQAPGSARPPLRPGERRPMHPTRVAPAGARPLGVGPGAGLPPPGPTRP